MKSEPLVEGNEGDRSAWTSPSGACLKTELLGLSVECPFDGTNPLTCPLHKIRNTTLRERCDWAEKLTKDEALHILAFHRECLREKQTSKYRVVRNLR